MVSIVPPRVVLDTNVMLRGFASDTSVAARLIEAAESRRFITLLSKPVLNEYVTILTDPDLHKRLPSLSHSRIELALRRLRFVGDYQQPVKARFLFPRDRRDEKFLELCISGQATHLLTHDNDLLSLPGAHSDAAKRLRQRSPSLQIMMPAIFVDNYRQALGIP